MSNLRVYFIPRGVNLNDLLMDATRKGPDKLLEIGKSPLPQDGKIRIKVTDVTFYPIDKIGKPIPVSEDKFYTFDIAEQVGNSKTGDIDIFVYARSDN